MQSVKVTVLMPIYNAEQYVRTAVDGILKQTYTDFELLIINDGSTDGTAEILKSYNDSRIRIYHQSNKGVSRTLNKGIELAKGQYIRRHDADDYSEPNMLEDQLNFLETHPEIDFVSTACAFMTDRGKVAYGYTQPRQHTFDNAKTYKLVSREMFNPYSPIVHGTVLGPTAVFKEMAGYRTAFLTSEDNDLWLRIIEKYKFAVLKHSYYYLRLNSTSATQVHKASLGFYRDLCLQFAEERQRIGTDPLQRGEVMPKPEPAEKQIEDSCEKGKCFRADILHFNYKIALNARDYVNIVKAIGFALRDGWRLKTTYKAIIFPILGDRWVQRGVHFKKWMPW
jgi:glycosyltransferase involved in cell wall biosynthesis